MPPLPQGCRAWLLLPACLAASLPACQVLSWTAAAGRAPLCSSWTGPSVLWVYGHVSIRLLQGEPRAPCLLRGAGLPPRPPLKTALPHCSWATVETVGRPGCAALWLSCCSGEPQATAALCSCGTLWEDRRTGGPTPPQHFRVSRSPRCRANIDAPEKQGRGWPHWPRLCVPSPGSSTRRARPLELKP